MTTALAKFGVYDKAGPDELAVLEMANTYRNELVDLNWQFHRDTLDFRERHFPALFELMKKRERVKHHIWTVEKKIKQYHSEVRDRNAVPPELGAELATFRVILKETIADIIETRKGYVECIKQARKLLGNSEDRKNCKTLEKREAMYSAISWPEGAVGDYGRIFIAHDMACRKLSRRYQDAGLHYAIRAEIVEATKPKLTKDSPGMRYEYSHRPDPRPWEKITLQFGDGGLTVVEALTGTPQFSLRPIYTNNSKNNGATIYAVRQRIGTGRDSAAIEYRVRVHRPLVEHMVIQRWGLIVKPGGKRLCVPIISYPKMEKPVGTGSFSYDLSWTKTEAGIRVCRFTGDHVSEDLILPAWLIAKRMCVKPTQVIADNDANDFLESRGIFKSKSPGKDTLFGISALEDFAERNPQDAAANNLYSNLLALLERAHRNAKQAERCIEDIYRNVVYRVCSRHASIVHDNIDLKNIKRYDTRDLLKRDILPEESREILHAVSPGKLRALLQGYPLASAEVLKGNEGAARGRENTDLFTSYVRGLGAKTGSKSNKPCRRSQNGSGNVVESVVA